jgi:pilus assembly protein Flp/PilA
MMRSPKQHDEGASAVEYGLLVAAIAAVVLIVVFAVGKFAKGSFQDTCDNLAAATSTATCG